MVVLQGSLSSADFRFYVIALGHAKAVLHDLLIQVSDPLFQQ